jgi:ferric-dicitrate binding protein FerR (iron transport regulator)
LRGELGPLGVGSGVPTGAWLETAAHGRAALRLPSGVSLRLDAGTRVQILSSSSAWLERGGVYVDSGEAAAAAPVQISTREGQVREVGTQFQVRAGNDGVQVRVREGLVILVGGGGRHEAPAGSHLDVAAGRVRRGEAPSHGPDWAWVEDTAPEYTLEGQPVDAFLKWAARETGRQIRFRDELSRRSATTARLHGSTRGLTPSEALEAVLPASGLVARLDGDTLWIAGDSAR